MKPGLSTTPGEVQIQRRTVKTVKCAKDTGKERSLMPVGVDTHLNGYC